MQLGRYDSVPSVASRRIDNPDFNPFELVDIRFDLTPQKIFKGSDEARFVRCRNCSAVMTQREVRNRTRIDVL